MVRGRAQEQQGQGKPGIAGHEAGSWGTGFRVGYSSAGRQVTHCSDLCGLDLIGNSLLGQGGRSSSRAGDQLGLRAGGRVTAGAESRERCSSAGSH